MEGSEGTIERRLWEQNSEDGNHGQKAQGMDKTMDDYGPKTGGGERKEEWLLLEKERGKKNNSGHLGR